MREKGSRNCEEIRPILTTRTGRFNLQNCRAIVHWFEHLRIASIMVVIGVAAHCFLLHFTGCPTCHLFGYCQSVSCIYRVTLIAARVVNSADLLTPSVDISSGVRQTVRNKNANKVANLNSHGLSIALMVSIFAASTMTRVTEGLQDAFVCRTEISGPDGSS